MPMNNQYSRHNKFFKFLKKQGRKIRNLSALIKKSLEPVT